VGDDLEEHGPTLATVTAGGQCFAQASLDHTHDRLDLPTLAVTTLFTGPSKIAPHHSAMVSTRRLGGRSADLCWDDRCDVQLVPQEHMHPFAIVARVGQQRVDGATPYGSAHHLDDMRMIRARTAPGNGRQNQMAVAVADQAHLRPTAIRGRLHGLQAFGTSPYEVAAGVMRLESRAIDCRQLQAFLEDLGLGGRDERLIKEAIRGVFFRSRSAAFCSVV